MRREGYRPSVSDRNSRSTESDEEDLFLQLGIDLPINDWLRTLKQLPMISILYPVGNCFPHICIQRDIAWDCLSLQPMANAVKAPYV